MKQLLFIVTAVLLFNNAFGQTDECRLGTDSAKADFSKGIIKIYIFGFAKSFTYGKILKDEYQIDAVYWGCVVDEKWDCYSKFMGSKIKEKYGNDVFEKAARKARYLDSLGGGDRESAFPGGETELLKFIYCNLDLGKAKYSFESKGMLYLKFVIDTVGKVTDIKIIKTPNEDYSNEAIRIISLMPDWIPATKGGKSIQQEWNLPIVFDYDWKQKNCQ